MWYCKQKGYKPWLKPKKKDTGTHEEGGHTIWYNEQQLLKVGCQAPRKTGLATAFWNGQDKAKACVAHVASSTPYPESPAHERHLRLETRGQHEVVPLCNAQNLHYL